MATRYGTETKKKPADVVEETVAYFGPQGLGLQVTRRTLTGIRLEGAGSFVEVTLRAGERTDVDLVAHGCESAVPAFLAKITR